MNEWENEQMGDDLMSMSTAWDGMPSVCSTGEASVET